MKFYCNDDTANRDVQIETPEEMLAIPRQDFKYNLIYLKEKKKLDYIASVLLLDY